MFHKNLDQSGFSLLEVIVALALLALAASMLIAWVDVSVNAEIRMRAIAAEEQLREGMLVRLAAVNITAEPNGEAELGGCRWRWAAIADGAPRTNYDGLRTGSFELQMYRVRATTLAASGDPRLCDIELDMELPMVGWRRTAPLLPGL
jgi:prepilin-type N-terminal cleavage/methylation domain-containing protein